MQHIPIQTTISSRNLSLVDSGFFNFRREDGVSIRVGAITVRIVVEPFNTSEAVVRREQDSGTLTVSYILTGNIPMGPFSFLNMAPDEIGISNGYKIYLNFKIVRLHQTQEILSMDYSIYVETDEQLNPRIYPITPTQPGAQS